MKIFAAVILFSLATIGFFTWFSNFGIPQVTPAPPPKEEVLDLGAMTMDQFAALGERIFNGRGTCKLCHNPVGGRAPLLDKIGEVVPTRLNAENYKGKASDVESYLYESMVDSSAYVVAGFGKAGTNDTVSPMPNVTGGSIKLSDAEIKSVIAYLQKSNGLEITVEIPKDAEAAPETDEAGPREPFATVEDMFTEFACVGCHKLGVGEEEGDIGPDLRQIGTLRDRDYLRRSLLDPNADIAKGFEPDAMPPDYGQQLYAVELEMIVDHLAGLK